LTSEQFYLTKLRQYTVTESWGQIQNL